MLDEVFKAIARLGDGFFGTTFRAAGRWYAANRTAGNLVILIVIIAVTLAIWGLKNAYLAGQAQGRREPLPDVTSTDYPGSAGLSAPTSVGLAGTVVANPTDTTLAIAAVRAQLNSPLLGNPGSAVYVDQLLFHYGDTVRAGEEILRLRTELCRIGVTAPQAGTLSALHVRAGDRVVDGQPLFEVNAHGGASDWR